MFKTNNEAVNKSYMLKFGSIVNSNVTIFFDFQNCKQIKSQLLLAFYLLFNMLRTYIANKIRWNHLLCLIIRYLNCIRMHSLKTSL